MAEMKAKAEERQARLPSAAQLSASTAHTLSSSSYSRGHELICFTPCSASAPAPPPHALQ